MNNLKSSLILITMLVLYIAVGTMDYQDALQLEQAVNRAAAADAINPPKVTNQFCPLPPADLQPASSVSACGEPSTAFGTHSDNGGRHALDHK